MIAKGLQIMKVKIAILSILLVGIPLFAFWLAGERKTLSQAGDPLSEIHPQSYRASAFAISPEIRSLDFQNEKLKGEPPKEKKREIPNNNAFRKQVPNPLPDPEIAPQEFSFVPMPAPILTFPGISSNDDQDMYGFRFVPSDANGDVGLTQYVQVVNSLIRVFDKSGNPQTPPFKPSTLFAPLNTNCALRNDGDIIVLYDPLADRWIISEYCTFAPPFRQMIAISKTGDAAGAYYIYEFVMPNNKLNDYSKLAIWSDGYYMSTDEFVGSDYAGSGAFAFNKEKMLAGDPTANYIYFDLASPSTIRFGGLLPSDIDGLLPPQAGTPNTFVGYKATEYGDPADSILLFDFRPDFSNPLNSTFTQRPESPVAVTAFDPTSNDGRSDIFPPPPSEALDSQSDRLMYRVAYRNMGITDSLVFNQSVRTSPPGQPYRAGVRFYELRRNLALGSPLSPFTVNTQATLGDNLISRWMGSAAQDWQGNLAIGYSTASGEKAPSIIYSGKLASESAFRSEASIADGTGVQTAFGFRWGDYSSMSVDPIDDCTFYYVNQYYTLESQKESSFGWLTRIGKFKFDECNPAPRARVNGIVTNSSNGQPIANALVKTALYSRATNSAGSYGDLLLLPNTYQITASAPGYRSQSITLSLANGQAITRDFALEPIAVLADSGNQIIAETCALNNSIDPGESIVINLSLRNTGSRNTNNLIAALQPSPQFSNASGPQNYGAMPVNGAAVSRQFSFTASPNLTCGDIFTLTLNLQDGAENLGSVSFLFNLGAKKIAFREDFDGDPIPGLPEGWSSSVTGAGVNWITSELNFESPPNALYSSATPIQPGTNQLVSPQFSIASQNAELEFRNRYDLESTFLRNRLYDGSILEIKIGLADWQDIQKAGGIFISGGYDGTIDTCCQNPLGGRLGWGSKSGINNVPVFITSKVKLPAAAAGQNVRLRWRTGSDIGGIREGQFIDDLKVTDGYTCCLESGPKAIFDFDGDGRSDLGIFRPSAAGNLPDFIVSNSGNSALVNTAWGTIGDIAANADYDGDGKSDYAIFRSSLQTWFILNSSNLSIQTIPFGLSNDKLAPADFDGDGKADVAVFRESNGSWYYLRSSDGEFRGIQFGATGDLPVQSDYDGDGKADIAVFRPANGVWYFLRSSDGAFRAEQFGANGDRPVAGDFDGDGKSDLAVFRPNISTWYLLKTTQGFSSIQFGISSDKPLQADFDGDGKRDIAVYRAANAAWYYLQSSNGEFKGFQFGANGDTPIPSIFLY